MIVPEIFLYPTRAFKYIILAFVNHLLFGGGAEDPVVVDCWDESRNIF
jgi:hypothetical protein